MRKTRGASFIEAAIALPIILIAIFGVIDACRYGFGLAMFQLGAHKGAEVASKLESLTSANAPIREQGIQQVRDEVLRFAGLSGVRMIEISGNTSPFLTLPAPGQAGMIRIEVIGTFNSLIPFIGQDLFIRAQSVTSTLATANNLDPMEMCLDQDGKFKPECACTFSQGELCDCPQGEVRLPDGTCQCVNQCITYGIDCECDFANCTGNFRPDPNDGCKCKCPFNFPCSPGGGPQNRWFRNMTTCTCDCDPNLTNHCTEQNKNPDPANCACLNEDKCPNPKTNEQCSLELNSPCAWFSFWSCACETCPSPGDGRVCVETSPGTWGCRCPGNCGDCVIQEWNCACNRCQGNLVRQGDRCQCPAGFCDFVQGQPSADPVIVNCNCQCRCPDGYQLIANRCVDINE